MAISEEYLRRAVDEVLEPVWAHERRRTFRRRAYSTVGRVIAGALVLWLVGFVVHLIVGVPFRWVDFGVIALLASIASLPELAGHSRLHRD